MTKDATLEAEAPSGEPAGRNRRKLRNFLKPRYHLRYTNLFIGGAVVTMATTVFTMHNRLGDVDRLLNSDDAMDLTGHLPVYEALTDITTIALGGFVVFVIFACALAMLINHRVAGPTTAIIDCINQLAQGNYQYDRRLRKGDELRDIHEALQNLGHALRRKQISTAPTRRNATGEEDAGPEPTDT